MIPLLTVAEEEELIRLLEAETAGISPFKDEWDFLGRAVWTRDEASGQIRKFPDYEYIRDMIESRRTSGAMFCIEKSRRMVVSWTFCALYLYDALTHANHANYIASRKLESSCELLDRLVFMHEHIPDEVWRDRPEIKTHAGPTGKGYKRIDVPRMGSFVEGVAEGKDQLRQYTASNILLDEFAFWQDAEGSWGALRPTIQGGGHIDIVSTPELGSYMFRLIYEEI